MIETKLQVPAVPSRALSRPELVERLSRDGCRVASVVAPAGFGKTTLLAQWAATVERPVAWVTLDHDDADPARLWWHIVGSLNGAVPGSFAKPSSWLGIGTADHVIPFVVNGMASVESGVVLVLDDYQEARSDEVDASVTRLIHHLPHGSTVAIASRHDAHVALARWRASEQLVELRQRQLRFTESEARLWLEAHVGDVGSETVQAFLEVTEGWPAAFALAFPSMIDSGNPTGAIAALSAGHRHVAEYIHEEVVGSWADYHPVLTVAALCPRISGSLVDHTLETEGSDQVLVELERSHLPFEALDHMGVWYRLHRLVADTLLAGMDGDPEQHRWMVRAADWYSRRGLFREALDLLLKSGEEEAAAEIINTSWMEQYRTGQLATLRRDLARVDPAVAAESAPYLVTHAWLLAYEGRSKDALRHLDRAETLWDGTPLPDGSPSVSAARAVMSSLFALEGLEAAVRSAEYADRVVDGCSAWRPLVDLGIGYATLMAGDLPRATAAFGRALNSTDPLVRAISTGWRSLLDTLEGDLVSARARLAEADLEFAGEPPLSDLPALVVARAALACVRGNPMSAAAELEACHARLGNSDPTDRLEVLIWLATAEAAIGRADRAYECLAEARSIIEALGGSAWHSARIAEVEQRLTPTSEPAGRDPGLTDRERHILQLLSATHLSQREIGQELGVSFNTVKSHVKAIYVKLGAASREEASQIARLRRLL